MGCYDSVCGGPIEGHSFSHPRLQLLDVYVLDDPNLDVAHLLAGALDSAVWVGQAGPVEEAQ